MSIKTTDRSVPSGHPRTRLGVIALVFYLLYMQMFSMFATDMYTPALPSMSAYFATGESLVNLTVMLFFAFMLVGMLLFGPLSDKYGRKPLLCVGCVFYSLASLVCALAFSIWMLLIARIFQALASGMVEVVAMALVKDCFDGRARENVLLWTQALFILGPIAAPLVGGWTLLFFTWRASFFILMALGLFGFLMSLVFKESLPPDQRITGSPLSSFGGLVKVARNRSFTLFMLVTTAFSAVPFTTYLMASPYIYEGHFSLSPQAYSYFFGATAALSVLAVPLYKLTQRWVSLRRMTSVLIVLAGLAGVGILVMGARSVVFFFLCMVVLYITGSMIRPYSTNILLEMCTNDVGAASSLMNFTYIVLGVIGAVPVLLVGEHSTAAIGLLILVGAACSLGLWFVLLRSRCVVSGVKDE
jgi:DHA1 family bicyclomycin/chloramphenicol resistance-like MFS transporter